MTPKTKRKVKLDSNSTNNKIHIDMEEKIYDWREIGVADFGDSVIVTDPCYTPDEWCNIHIMVSRGQYKSFVRFQGNRVAELRVVKKEVLEAYKNINYVHFSPEPICGTIGVDSGQCGIFDTGYFEENYNDDDYNDPDSWYHIVCNLTLTENAGVIDKKGAVSSTGYGDGMYLLYPCFDWKDIVGLSILFMDDIEDEE